MKDKLQCASALVGVIAALLWLIATLVYVRPRTRQSEAGWDDAQITANDQDVIETARLQTWWNMWAALATGVAAALQAASYFFN